MIKKREEKVKMYFSIGQQPRGCFPRTEALAGGWRANVLVWWGIFWGCLLGEEGCGYVRGGWMELPWVWGGWEVWGVHSKNRSILTKRDTETHPWKFRSYLPQPFYLPGKLLYLPKHACLTVTKGGFPFTGSFCTCGSPKHLSVWILPSPETFLLRDTRAL